MAITSERLIGEFGEAEAQALCNEVRRQGDFVGFARRFMHDENPRVARNALWTLTKTSKAEIAQLQGMQNEWVELAMQTEHSAVRRLSLNIVERLAMDKEDLRTDFLDFCLDHMADVEELPGIQSVSMKLAYRMCQFYPELMGELERRLEAMQIEFYKPAVKCVRNRIMTGKLKSR